jgi:FMN phosphatase YigB (HAD superfamily)
MSPQYRALSLDLHDTLVWDTRELVDAQYEVRLQLLAQALRTADGKHVAMGELRKSRAALHSEWVTEGRSAETVRLDDQVDQIRRRLRARYAADVNDAVRQYAAGGLREHPSRINPDAQLLVSSLNEVGFPVIVTTNTSRSGFAWQAFLEEVGGIRPTDVVASTDVGVSKPDARIFEEVARRARVLPSEILHVGDSWPLDVEGALRYGMDAALYRGLSPHYWDPDKLNEKQPPNKSSVPVLDHLSEVRDLLGLA